DEGLLNDLIHYCIQCAKKHHPAYLVPVEQCLAHLTKDYPEIVARVFIWTSFIPAHNHEYVASHAIRTSNKIQDFFDANKNPVFILRSQLPITTSTTTSTTTWTILSSYFFRKTNRDLRHGLESRFPVLEAQLPHKTPNYNIYVSPFQFRPIEYLSKTDPNNPPKGLRKVFNYIAAKIPKGKTKRIQNGPRKVSVFTYITKRGLFDNPAIAVILRFKW
ncbi:hypothetical protein BGZ65_001334, partial [Modicella reniformis]